MGNIKVVPFNENDSTDDVGGVGEGARELQDEESDDDEERENIRIEWVRADMNRKSSALNRLIRDYVDDGAISAKISTHVLDEISDMLECLDDEEMKFVDANRTVAMLNMCWAWFQKNEKDPASNCDPRKTELLLRNVMEFCLSTIAPPTGTELG